MQYSIISLLQKNLTYTSALCLWSFSRIQCMWLHLWMNVYFYLFLLSTLFLNSLPNSSQMRDACGSLLKESTSFEDYSRVFQVLWTMWSLWSYFGWRISMWIRRLVCLLEFLSQWRQWNSIILIWTHCEMGFWIVLSTLSNINLLD